jgi:hypothetical protein
MVMDLDRLEAELTIGFRERDLAQRDDVLTVIEDIVDLQLPGGVPLRGEECLPSVLTSSNGPGERGIAEDVPLRILSEWSGTWVVHGAEEQDRAGLAVADGERERPVHGTEGGRRRSPWPRR